MPWKFKRIDVHHFCLVCGMCILKYLYVVRNLFSILMEKNIFVPSLMLEIHVISILKFLFDLSLKQICHSTLIKKYFFEHRR